MKNYRLSNTAYHHVIEWMKLPYEVVAEVSISSNKIINIVRILSEPPTVSGIGRAIPPTSDSRSCHPKHVEIRPLMIHTHPRSCVGDNYGWASGQDIKTILDNDLDIHFIASQEGMYVVENSNYNWNSLSSKNKKYWINLMDIPNDQDITIDEYIEHINSLGWVDINIKLIEYI